MSYFEVNNITVAFGGVRALNDVSFSVKQNEIFTIIGPNGAGKSTLFNVISRIYQPNDGNVSLALGASSLSFTPSTSFIGITTFNYTVSDGSLESNGTVEIVVSRASSLPSWRFLKKFGFYNQTSQDWIYHNDLGCEHLQGITKSTF